MQTDNLSADTLTVRNMRQRRPVVLVSVHSELIRRDLISSGVLASLADRYQFDFLVSREVDTVELEKIGAVVGVFRGGWGRSWLWNNVAILSSIYRWTPIVGQLARSYFTRKLSNNYSLRVRFLVFANRVGLAPLLIALGRFGLGLNVNRAVDGERLGLPDLIVAPTGLRDMVADDLVRWGAKRRIPTLFLQINSDVFNMKIPTSEADYFAVWGDQSWYLARLVCYYPVSRLKIVGSPRFEFYEKNRVSKEDARRILDLSPDARLILFCGATAAFDETRALKQLDAAICSRDLPAETRVLYKPHPKGQVRGATSPFELSQFRNVRLAPEAAPGRWSSPEIYPLLLSAADVLISPYSTMGLEGALHGLPVLCVGYHPGRFETYWRWARDFTHLHIYRDRRWCVTCHDELEFLPGVQRVLRLAGDPVIAEAARNDVRSVAKRDGCSVAERLSQCFDQVLAERGWKTV